MASPKALVNPELLVWAREKTHLSVEVAAKKIGVKPHQLMAWEAGEDHPTMKQLYEVSRVFQRPLSLFYLEEIPRDFSVAITDFRRTSVRDDLPYELVKEIKLAQEKRAVAIELLEETDELPPGFPHRESIDVDTAVDVAAQRVRDWLGISSETQSGWKNIYEAYSTWRSAIERMNVLVFQTVANRYSLEAKVASGFSLSFPCLPIIVVNGRDPISRRIFTLIHELVHLTLQTDEGPGSICDSWRHDPSAQGKSRSLEAKCNAIAGRVLVPEIHLLVAKPSQSVSNDGIQALANQFWVSREVIIRRLLELQEVDYDFYIEKSDQFWREWLNREKPKSDSGPPQARIVYASNGEAFVRIVLGAYAERRISLVDAAWYLNARAKQVSRVQQLVSEAT